MTIPTILLPAPGDARPYKHLYEKWRVERDLANPAPKIENVKFAHDPQWRTRIMSIQCAHDHEHWVWAVVWVFFQLATIALPVTGGLIGFGLLR